MKREILILGACLTILSCSLHAKIKETALAQADTTEEEDFVIDEEDDFDDEASKARLEKERKKREEQERLRKEEEDRKAAAAKREAMRKRQIRDRKIAEEKAKELDAYREANADVREYTVNPGSVELVVEMDPNSYGFRTRNHRMTMAGEFDFILRGRSMLHYDYRFFNYLSLGIVAGIDWSAVSLYSRFREHLSKPAPSQLSILGGVAGKWRLTEWYMRSSIFLEPSILFGHMWQTFVGQKTTHFLLRPGLFAGIETVFDSGLTVNTRVGVEFPIYFGGQNPIKEVAEPLFLIGLGFAI